ncbi:hypothetical protein TRAPUB_10014 [Trametes pubescens]|uniref:Uncharacterized protein n=1 Tax=Trametes pubescens TaxID=154538 RepID=A0A1M2W0X4_TRAPU|nr:hypothetical protein TRAPUB_10014 [Trametes pubescens]
MLRDEVSELDLVGPTLQGLLDRPANLPDPDNKFGGIVHGLLPACLLNVDAMSGRGGPICNRKIESNSLAAVLILTALPGTVPVGQPIIEHRFFVVSQKLAEGGELEQASVEARNAGSSLSSAAASAADAVATFAQGRARAFGTTEEESGASEEVRASGDETVSTLPIMIKESALPEHTQSPADVEEEEDRAAVHTAYVDVPPVVIGRGKEGVEAAQNCVADLEGDKTSPPDDAQKSADSDAVAHALKEEIGGEAQARPAPSPPLHQGL